MLGALRAVAAPVSAELRSAATLIPAGTVAGFPPSAPAGGATVAAQPYVCDASEGLAPLVAVDASPDPILAVSASGLHLPFLGNVAPAACGQIVFDGSGNVYVTQGALASNTASAATGILRQAVDPASGLLSGLPVVIAANSGLGGNLPTAVAMGPDGALYFGNLKNGDIKRILNPGSGTTQVVQSVGKTPNGRPMRAMAFLGNDLYLGSSDSLSVISGATSASCTGGCNAIAVSDGFAGIPHVGVASDGAGSVFFAVSGSVNQVWRYSPATLALAEVAAGGADRNGANASAFSFVDAKTNLLALDATGNLWIGDDPAKGVVPGTGRVWTISSAILATTAGGQARVDPTFLADIVAPWQASVGTTLTFPTFNADFTFTISIVAPDGTVTNDSGTWTLGPPLAPSAVLNPQGHLTMTDAAGVVLLDGDVILISRDQFWMVNATDSITPVPFLAQIVFTRRVL